MSAKFCGLFIGVDRYRSAEINELRCAQRDAEALYSIFSDTLGTEGAKLLTNEDATRQNIVDDIKGRLFSVAPEDFVVISFSGHGSDDHFIVTHDADPYNFSASTIALSELVELFSQIPAKNVLLILDCCFSGGAGARVFHHEIAKRGIESTDALLNKISGTGRIIFTASGPLEEAIEDRRRGHGLLTQYLIEALLGVPEVLENGAIKFYSLLEYVTQRVTVGAEIYRHKQSPAFRGTLDGEVLLPVFRKGDLFAKFFPDKSKSKIGSLVAGLAAFGIPDGILNIWKSRIPSLNALQQEAINDYDLLEAAHLVVSAPTSSGKTLVAEIASVKACFNNERSVFLLPLRALVNDKFAEFTEKYGSYGLRVVRATGEISDDIPALLRGKYDIALLTYEKFANLLLANPFIINNIGLVVVDEAQMLCDKTRGANLEFLLTLLRTQRVMGIEPQIVLLSAVIGQTNSLEKWLGAKLLRRNDRPVPLREGLICADGSFRHLDPNGNEKRIPFITPEYRKGSSQDFIIPLTRKLVADGEKVLIFRATKGETRGTANYLAENLGLQAASDIIDALPKGDPSASSQTLANCLRQGVAFHNADLDMGERAVIEDAFRDPNSKLRVLVATTTVAMGVNTPASSVIIAGLVHPGDVSYSVSEYKNMVGRAGRLGFVAEGKSFVISTSGIEEHRNWENYVKGRPEDLASSFGEGNLHSIVTRVLATASATRASGMSAQDIVAFLQNSFAAIQRAPGTHNWSEAQILRTIAELEENELICRDTLGYRLTDLGKLSGETGTDVSSIVRLVETLRDVPQAQLSDAALVTATQIVLELDSVYFPIHKKSHQERARWRDYVSRKSIPRAIFSSLERNAHDGHECTSRFKRASACMMWIDGIDIGKIEESLLQHCRDSDAAGAIRGTASRTRDLVATTARVAEVLGGASIDLSKRVEDLLIQLELGLPAELIPLAKVIGNSLGRSDYLALRGRGVVTADELEKIPDTELQLIVGSKKKVSLVKKALAEEASG